MARSRGGMAASASWTALSPSAAAFSSLARALIAARSSAENVWPVAAFFAPFFAGFVLASAKHLLFDDSAQLLDADQVARGIADGAVANAVRLLRRLLDDIGAAGLQLLEGGVEVGRGE